MKVSAANVKPRDPEPKLPSTEECNPPIVTASERSEGSLEIPMSGSGGLENANLVQGRLNYLDKKLEEILDAEELSAVQLKELAHLEKEIGLLKQFEKYIAFPIQLYAQQNDPDQKSETPLADMRHIHGLLQKQESTICRELKQLYGPGNDSDVLEHIRKSFANALCLLQMAIATAEQNQQDKARAVDLRGLVVGLKAFQKQIGLCFARGKPNDDGVELTNKSLNRMLNETESATNTIDGVKPDDLGSAQQAASLAKVLRNFIEVQGKKVRALSDVQFIEGWKRLEQLINDEVELLDDIVGSSPLTKSRMYQAKQQMVQAAIDALKLVQGDANTYSMAKEKLDAQIESLETRRNALMNAANSELNQKTLADPADVIGRKPLDSFLDRLFRGHKVEAQRKALNEDIAKLMSKKTSNKVKIDLAVFNEQALMEGVLKNALERVGLARAYDVSDLYRRAHSNLLNKDSGSWKEIKVSMRTTTAPPAGSAQSPISRFFTNVIRPAREFGGQLNHLYKKHDLCGINSHCTTEYRHAVNFAKTETLDANGNRIFSGYRAATLSAYQITPEQMRKMSDAEVQGMLEYLLPIETALQHRQVRSTRLGWVKRTIDEKGEITNQVENHPGHRVNHANQMQYLVRKARTDAGFCAQLRAEAAYHRAREVVTGMVQNRLRNEPELVEQTRRGETMIEDMCITSMSLLTPDMINMTGELRMQEEQFKAWERIREEAKNGVLKIKVQLPTESGVKEEWKEVGFKNLQVLTFDFGVNSGAIGNTSWLPGSGGWRFADSHNAKGFEALFGKDRQSGIFQKRYQKMEQRRAGLAAEISTLEEGVNGSIDLQKHREKVEELKLLDYQIRAASQLRQQIQQMRDDKSYQDAGNEPYKMVSRLAVLGSLLGIQLVFNCKSGKDRTGETDAEAKYIASRIARGLRVHEPNERLDKEEFRNRQWFVLRSGNHEMQAYNTGLGGYKLSGVDRLYKQFHRYVLTDFLGLSAYTRS